MNVGALVAVLLVVAGCGGFGDPGVEAAPPLSPVPGMSVIRTVGTIAGESAQGNVTEFRLTSGAIVTVDFSTTRQIGLPGGSPAILVLGRDNRSDWVAVVGHQVGAPAGCHVLNLVGHELGDSIAIGGVRWRKAPNFSSPGSLPGIGQAYSDGTRFCLDEIGRVHTVIPMEGS